MSDTKDQAWDKLYTAGKEMLFHGKDLEEIQKHLLTLSDDETLIFAVVKKLKAEHHALNAQMGRKLLLIGLIFMLAGFIITCINYHSNRSISFAMYGLTSFGLVILFYGLYKIIG
jgi:hypothetical protein